MAYRKHTWTDNELITKDLLNNIENGIAEITVPEDATTEVKGIVKMAAKVDVIGTADAVTAKETYTQADINGMVTLINKNKEKINEILPALKNAGIMKNA